jgi:hypothetical protein
MDTEHFIPADKFCECHEIEVSFINSLNEMGLIEVTKIEENQYIFKGQINDLEKMVRFHYEMGINIEGIDAIYHLLQRLDNMHDEVNALKNRLKLYEESKE